MKHSIRREKLSGDLKEKTAELFFSNKEKLDSYTEQLLWWNERMNLISRNVPRETLEQHVFHSMLLSNVEAFKTGGDILDTGTGGGLPGIPLAICNPDKQFHLNDIVSKKIMAVKQMGRKLSLANLNTSAHSIEKVQPESGVVIISKHAFKINDLIKMTADKPWSAILLLKGEEEVEQELEGIVQALEITVYPLFDLMEEDFYKGKAIVEIKRAS